MPPHDDPRTTERRQRLDLRLTAEPRSVTLARQAVREHAVVLGLPSEQVGMVALAVTEAATNAVVHAYLGREPGELEISAEPADGGLVVVVRDDGRGLTPRHDSPGLGLGLPTIGRCCSHLDIGPGPGGQGTEVRMRFDAPQLVATDGDGRQADPDRTRQRLEAVLGAVGEAVTVNDAQGRVLYANAAAAELLGASSADEVLATPAHELTERFSILGEDGSPVRAEDLPDQQALAGREPEPLLTYSVHLPSGRGRWLLTTSRPLEDEEAGPLSVNTIRDVTAATQAARRQRFLAEAGERLAASLDLQETLSEIASLAVPALADWCAVDLARADGSLERVALAHVDPDKVALGREIHARFPPDPASDGNQYAALRTGQPVFHPRLPDELLAARIEDPEHLRLLRSIGLRSALMAPMVARGATLGVLTLVTADSGRVFAEDDVDFAMAVARRAAVAVDTARRFAER